MVAFSALRSTFAGLNNGRTSLNRFLTFANQQNVTKAPARLMGSGRSMQIKPSNYEYTIYKDHLHFYVLLGLIPIGLIITYANAFVGQSELSEVPEDYRPKHWEYHRHPITRFIAKYIQQPPERFYEMHLHFLDHERKRIEMRTLEKKVKELMAERADYKSWYYAPVRDQVVFKAHEINKKTEEEDLSP